MKKKTISVDAKEQTTQKIGIAPFGGTGVVSKDLRDTINVNIQQQIQDHYTALREELYTLKVKMNDANLRPGVSRNRLLEQFFDRIDPLLSIDLDTDVRVEVDHQLIGPFGTSFAIQFASELKEDVEKLKTNNTNGFLNNCVTGLVESTEKFKELLDRSVYCCTPLDITQIQEINEQITKYLAVLKQEHTLSDCSELNNKGPIYDSSRQHLADTLDSIKKHVERESLSNSESKMSTQEQFRFDLDKVLTSLNKLLKTKNLNYGNASLSPLKIFNKSDDSTIPGRLDEKLARIKNSDTLRDSDVVDLMGYLTLLCIQKGWNNFDHLVN